MPSRGAIGEVPLNEEAARCGEPLKGLVAAQLTSLPHRGDTAGDSTRHAREKLPSWPTWPKMAGEGRRLGNCRVCRKVQGWGRGRRPRPLVVRPARAMRIARHALAGTSLTGNSSTLHPARPCWHLQPMPGPLAPSLPPVPLGDHFSVAQFDSGSLPRPVGHRTLVPLHIAHFPRQSAGCLW